MWPHRYNGVWKAEVGVFLEAVLDPQNEIPHGKGKIAGNTWSSSHQFLSNALSPTFEIEEGKKRKGQYFFRYVFLLARRCIGSIQHLKDKLGKDYILELRVKEAAQVTCVHTEILKLFPQVAPQERWRTMEKCVGFTHFTHSVVSFLLCEDFRVIWLHNKS